MQKKKKKTIERMKLVEGMHISGSQSVWIRRAVKDGGFDWGWCSRFSGPCKG